MKKLAIFFIIIIAIVATVAYIYLNQMATYRTTQKENAKFDLKEGQELTGQDLATIINKAIDTNEKNKVEKDESGKYIGNNENSINIEITFTDVDITYSIETIQKAGINKFVQNYRGIIFKCKEIEYHKSTGRTKYIKFEQITE